MSPKNRRGRSILERANHHGPRGVPISAIEKPADDEMFPIDGAQASWDIMGCDVVG